METKAAETEAFVVVAVPASLGGGWSVIGDPMPSGAPYEDRRCMTQADAEAHRDALHAGTVTPRISRVLRTLSVREAAKAAYRATGLPPLQRSLERRGR